jgi:hypothetical protein
MLIKRLQNLPQKIYQEFHHPFSLDVVSLHTLIPVSDAINTLIDVLKSQNITKLNQLKLYIT